jgi:hypothetical protein
LGAVPPLGPTPEYPRSSPRQAPACCRQRLCLLKGCEQPFQPRHPLARYCSTACRQAARRWSLWRANQRYRSSEQGRCHRREQAHRWRTRAARRCAPEPTAEYLCEGYHKARSAQEFCCSRPGCYEGFTQTNRSPLQKFCSFLCRRALWRVLQRESRWLRSRTTPRAAARQSAVSADP